MNDGSETAPSPDQPTAGFGLEFPLQQAPLLFTEDCLPLFLGDHYQGRPAILLCGSRAVCDETWETIRCSGALTAGLDNATARYPTDLWISVHRPRHFSPSHWQNPRALKLIPHRFSSESLFDPLTWIPLNGAVRNYPSVAYFMTHGDFNPSTFLHEPTVNTGVDGYLGGAESSLFAALRLLFFLGVRQVFTLGLRAATESYLVRRKRDESSILADAPLASCLLLERLSVLAPVFAENGYEVFDCDDGEETSPFPSVDTGEAIRYCSPNSQGEAPQPYTA